MSTSFLIDFKLAYDLATILPPVRPQPSSSPTLPDLVATKNLDRSPATVTVSETFHPGSTSPQPSVLSSSSSDQSTPQPNRFRRHTTSSIPYIRPPTSLTTSESVQPDTSSGSCPKLEVPVRSRHQTAPSTCYYLSPNLVELLNHLATLYRSVWKLIREGHSLAEALEHYHLTPQMWNTRRLIAETWICYPDLYRANLYIRSRLCGVPRRGLVMQALSQAANKTLNQGNRKRKLRVLRRAGIIMSRS